MDSVELFLISEEDLHHRVRRCATRRHNPLLGDFPFINSSSVLSFIRHLSTVGPKLRLLYCFTFVVVISMRQFVQYSRNLVCG